MSKKTQIHRSKKEARKQPHSCDELVAQYQKKLDQYQKELKQAKERELKALADYNNLVKRQVNQQQRLSQMAALDLIEKLLSPLNHLSLAAEHLNDQGIQMVVDEFWQVLNAAGLEEINPLNQDFDESTMEAVEKEGEGHKVKKVLQRGYVYKGQVVKPARVVVG